MAAKIAKITNFKRVPIIYIVSNVRSCRVIFKLLLKNITKVRRGTRVNNYNHRLMISATVPSSDGNRVGVDDCKLLAYDLNVICRCVNKIDPSCSLFQHVTYAMFILG